MKFSGIFLVLNIIRYSKDIKDIKYNQNKTSTVGGPGRGLN